MEHLIIKSCTCTRAINPVYYCLNHGTYKCLAILSLAWATQTVPNAAQAIHIEVEQRSQEQLETPVVHESLAGSNTTEQVSYVTTDNFEKEALESDLPVLVVFTAPWCGPCRILDPVIEALMPEMSGRAKVFKLDTDVSPEISTKYKVTRLPTIIFFNGGQESYRTTNIYPRDAYVNYLHGLSENISVEESTLQLLEKDWFRRHFLLTEQVEDIEKILEKFPSLLTKEFVNGQTPLSLVLNFPSNTQRDVLELILAQKPAIGTNDLLGLGRCEEFLKVIENDPGAVNRADPDGNTPLFTALITAGLLEHGECVRTVLDSGTERSLPQTIRNSLGEKVAFQPDSKLVEELLNLVPMKWGPKWHNTDVGVKRRVFLLEEIFRVRNLRSEHLIAKRPP